jgi:transcriptional regulator with XRE-family HTH domain
MLSVVKRPRTYSPLTEEAARLLGERVRLARRERRWTVEELAERVGVAHVTISKVERGDLTVALGTALEAAVIVGVVLFDSDPSRRAIEAGRVADRLALLPKAVRSPALVDDDF